MQTSFFAMDGEKYHCMPLISILVQGNCSLQSDKYSVQQASGGSIERETWMSKRSTQSFQGKARMSERMPHYDSVQ